MKKVSAIARRQSIILDVDMVFSQCPEMERYAAADRAFQTMNRHIAATREKVTMAALLYMTGSI